MKLCIKLLPLIATPLIFGSCAATEHHTVRLYEYRQSAPKSSPQKAKSDDPRDFVPKQKF